MSRILSEKFEFPKQQQEAFNRAKRLEWISLIYLTTVVIAMYLAMGSSQAMKTAWLEDVLSLIPPAVFLIAGRFSSKEATKHFPYGFHRSTMLAFLCAALALLSMGAFLFIDSAIKLLTQERPTIGSIELLGKDIWLGWVMIAALIYSGIPPVILARMKQPLAREIHDKALYADADMGKADWLTCMAAILGVLGIAYGYWWSDAVAAIIISLDVLHDGYANMREVVSTLLGEVPKSTDREKIDDLPDRLRSFFKALDWVDDAGVRMREEGHVYFGEVFVVPREDTDLTQRIHEAILAARKLSWKLHDIVVNPVPSLDTLPRRD